MTEEPPEGLNREGTIRLATAQGRKRIFKVLYDLVDLSPQNLAKPAWQRNDWIHCYYEIVNLSPQALQRKKR